MKAPAPKREPGVTLRAMRAAAASDLPARLKHFVMVLALGAHWRTGVGYRSQASLAAAMGVGTRHVRRLWLELDAAWEAQESPVAAHREARFHTSDTYRLEVRSGWGSTMDRAVQLAGPAAEVGPGVERLSATGRPAIGDSGPAIHDTSTGSREPLHSSQPALQSPLSDICARPTGESTYEVTKKKEATRAPGLAGAGGAAAGAQGESARGAGGAGLDDAFARAQRRAAEMKLRAAERRSKVRKGES